jgi:hypothetical protein
LSVAHTRVKKKLREPGKGYWKNIYRYMELVKLNILMSFISLALSRFVRKDK